LNHWEWVDGLRASFPVVQKLCHEIFALEVQVRHVCLDGRSIEC